MDKTLQTMVSDTQRLAPLAAGSVAGVLANRALSPHLAQLPVIGEHKEFHSLIIMLVGVMGKTNKVGGREMMKVWDGVTVAGVVSLADNLALRIGVDLL